MPTRFTLSRHVHLALAFVCFSGRSITILLGIHLMFVMVQHPRRPVLSAALLVTSFLLTAAFMSPHRVNNSAAAATGVQRIAVSPGRAQQTISFRDRLVVGLQARLKSEVAFVELVALRVRTGQLPQRLVDETFFWARDRAAVSRPGRAPRRPIIFFQPAMTLRAKKLGVAL